MKTKIATLIFVGSLILARADQMIESVQQALKDQGFYYGEVTGEKDADTTAAIRRYQIRNGLQITGEVNDETLKSLGVDSSGAATTAKATPPPARSAAPDESDLRAEPRENSGPTNPLTGQPFPEPQKRSASPPLRRDEQAPAQPDYETAP